MPRRPEQFEAIREKSREKILLAALDLFANRGYQNTSVENIAKAAGISKGLIYNYYDSKKSILLAIYEDIMQQAEMLITRHSSERDLYKRRKNTIEEAFKMLMENPEYLKLIFVISLQPGVMEDTKDYSPKMFQKNKELISSAYSGAGGEDLYESLMLDALMDGIMINYIRYGKLYPINELKQRLIEKYCNPKRRGS